MKIEGLKPGDFVRIASVDGGNGWNPDQSLWDQYLIDQDTGRRTVLLAWEAEGPIGYGSLLWASEYEPFQHQSIPEINNLSVAVSHRKRGVATSLIRALEALARSSGRSMVGIGVGLYPDYGSAQRLYVELGYRPDGRGITYAGTVVAPGTHVRLDDDLILWLTKAV